MKCWESRVTYWMPTHTTILVFTYGIQSVCELFTLVIACLARGCSSASAQYPEKAVCHKSPAWEKITTQKRISYWRSWSKVYGEYCPGALSPFPLKETHQVRLGVSLHLSLPWELSAGLLGTPAARWAEWLLLAVPTTPERRWIFGGGSEQKKCWNELNV